MIKTLEEFNVYNLALGLSEEVWKSVSGWSYFEKDTVGKQLVRASDSIAANLSEGLGRYHVKEIKNFSYYSRGSVFETKTWLTKANNRNLIDQKHFTKLLADLEIVGKMLNSYINTLKPLVPETKVPKPNPQVLTPKT